MKRKKEDISKSQTLNKLNISSDVPYSFKDVQQNPKIVYPYLLPEDTNRLYIIKEMYAYFSYQTKSEFERQWNKASSDIHSTIVNFAKQATDLYVNVD